MSEVFLADEAATERAGRRLAAAWIAAGRPALLVTLAGDLGAGKTCLVRGLLRALGEQGAIRSPTYTLLESYRPAPETVVHHLDCYRLTGWPALEELGFRDLAAEPALIAVEWPGRVPGLEEAADLVLQLAVEGEGRRLAMTARSAGGRTILGGLLLA